MTSGQEKAKKCDRGTWNTALDGTLIYPLLRNLENKEMLASQIQFFFCFYKSDVLTAKIF